MNIVTQPRSAPHAKLVAENINSSNNSFIIGPVVDPKALDVRNLPDKLLNTARQILTERISAIIAQLGANSPADMGKVMGVASKELAGLAEGRAISGKVGELLKK